MNSIRSILHFKEKLRSLGAKPEHETRILRAWVRGQRISECRFRSDLYYPRALNQAFPALEEELAALTVLRSAHPARDGSMRLLLKLGDGELIETVALPRDGVCVSSQVGCAVGCVFCKTGQSGLIRQVGSAEIIGQVLAAQKVQTLRKVVFMGMGEPSHNLGAVLEAIDLLGTEGAFGHKQLVLSTVGDERVFERLPQGRVKPALAISLHSMNFEKRKKLVPKASSIPPLRLIELAQEYAERTTYPIQYQWTLIEGVNDQEEEVEALVEALAGKRAMLNLIPLNRVEGGKAMVFGMDGLSVSEFRRPGWDKIRAMVRSLHSRGVLTKVRYSAGQEVEGGCGQLRARAEGLLTP